MKTTPKDFFLWAGAMVALYFSIGSFVALSFEYIERLVGVSSLVGYNPYSSGIRFAIATSIVLFPVYLFLTRVLNKDIRKNQEKKELWVRRWLIFLTIFASAIALIVDVIILINTFLGGEELTTAFLLKILTVFIIFGGVFYYYLQDIRGVWEENEKISKLIGLIVTFLLISSILGGFFIMGSPYKQRLYRYDEQRINNLRSLQNEITQYYRTTKKLPKTLNDLKNPLANNYIPKDPETNNLYEYKKIDDLSFQICANFSLPFPKINNSKVVTKNNWRIQELKRTAENWNHKAGRTCYKRTIDPKLITPFSKEPLPIRSM